MLVLAAGRSQIGEFSFLLAQSGIALGIFTGGQYTLVLASAILSILVNPFMFRLIAPAESLLRRSPALWRWLDRHGPTPQAPTEGMSGHVVVVGYGRVGQHVVTVLEHLDVPRLVVEQDIGRAVELDQRGTPTLYGDAADSEVLGHAGLDRARLLVVTLPDDAAAEVVVAAGRAQNKRLPIIARAATQAAIGRLFTLGAEDVIQPELEGGLEIVRHTLIRLGYPGAEIDDYAEAVRQDRYDISVSTATEQDALDRLAQTRQQPGVAWFCIGARSPLEDQALADVRLKSHNGARIIAVLRDGQVTAHPGSTFRLRANDLVSIVSDDRVDGRAVDAPGELDEMVNIANPGARLLESDRLAESEEP